MQHEISDIDLFPHTEGIASLPSEHGENTLTTTVRNFLIQSQRFFSAEALDNNSDLWELKDVADFEGVNNDLNLFAVSVKLQPKTGSLEDWVEENGDQFFDDLLNVASVSNSPRIRGKRPVFLSCFEVEDTPDGKIFVSTLLIGTSVFYNDYRVTVNFPDLSDKQSMFEQTKNLFNQMQAWHDSIFLEFDVSWTGLDKDDGDGFTQGSVRAYQI